MHMMHHVSNEKLRDNVSMLACTYTSATLRAL